MPGKYEIGCDMRGYGVNAKKITFRVAPLPRNNDISMRGTATPEIGVNSERELHAIVDAVSKRLINNNDTISYLNTYHGKLATLEENKATIEGRMQKLFGDAPNTCRRPNMTKTSTRIDFCQKYGTSFSATIYNDGSINFERIGSLDNERALRILAILAEKVTD